MKTDHLIAALAADAAPRGPGLRPALAGALALGALLAALVFAALLGVRGSFMASLSSPQFLLKFLVTALLAGTSLMLVERLARPGVRRRRFWFLLLVPVAILAGAVGAELARLPTALWETRMVGTNWLLCLTFVPLIALAPLALALLALRRGASEAPAWSGFAAGLLAGAIGAFLYAAHCPDDSPLFVAVWYTLAILSVGVLGAIAGRTLLRW